LDEAEATDNVDSFAVGAGYFSEENMASLDSNASTTLTWQPADRSTTNQHSHHPRADLAKTKGPRKRIISEHPPPISAIDILCYSRRPPEFNLLDALLRDHLHRIAILEITPGNSEAIDYIPGQTPRESISLDETICRGA